MTLFARARLLVLCLPVLVAASDCSTCEPTDGEVVFDAAPEDLDEYGIGSPDEIDEDTCYAMCDDLGGMSEATFCESEDAGDGWATIYCEGTFDC